MTTESASPEKRLAELGLTLPALGSSAGNYVPFTRAGRLVFISGQVPIGPNGPITGRVGDTITEAEARDAARITGLRILAVVGDKVGDHLLDGAVRVTTVENPVADVGDPATIAFLRGLACRRRTRRAPPCRPWPAATPRCPRG